MPLVSCKLSFTWILHLNYIQHTKCPTFHLNFMQHAKSITNWLFISWVRLSCVRLCFLLLIYNASLVIFKFPFTWFFPFAFHATPQVSKISLAFHATSQVYNHVHSFSLKQGSPCKSMLLGFFFSFFLSWVRVSCKSTILFFFVSCMIVQGAIYRLYKHYCKMPLVIIKLSFTCNLPFTFHAAHQVSKISLAIKWNLPFCNGWIPHIKKQADFTFYY